MISVVIPTYNAGEGIENLLSMLRRSRAVDEIIVIDSSSADNTGNVAEAYASKVISIKKSEFNHGATRTLGAKTAGGDILVFMTQDILPFDEQFIENLVKPLTEDGKVAAAYGRQLPHHDATPFASHLRLFNYPPDSCIKSFSDRQRLGIKAAFLSNSFAAYNKAALEEVGWFKEDLIISEDTYVGARLLQAGYRIAYVSDAVVYHSHNYTPFKEFRRYFDIGTFHKTEDWIIEVFGKAEGEGARYLKSELEYLLSRRKYHLLPVFVWRNFFKYMGYKLGQNYRMLPERMVKHLRFKA